MAKHADFYPLILPAVLGAPYPTVDFAINRAAIDLCERARVWEEAIDASTLVAGIDAYLLDLPRGASLVCVRNVRLDGHALALVESWAELDRRAEPPSSPRCYTMRGDEIVVYPAPAAEAAGGQLTLVATLKPTYTATALPDVLLAGHMAALAEGAKAYLKEMSGTPWFDPNGAAVAQARFNESMSRARINVEHGFAAGSLSVTPRAFGALR